MFFKKGNTFLSRIISCSNNVESYIMLTNPNEILEDVKQFEDCLNRRKFQKDMVCKNFQSKKQVYSELKKY